MSEVNQVEIKIEKGGEAQIVATLVKTLLEFAAGKTIAGYFLIRNDEGGSYSVSSIEWANGKKEEDLRQCLLSNLLEETAPFAIFSVTATPVDGKLRLAYSARRLDCFQAEKEGLNNLMNKTMDSYCEDFRQRADAAISASAGS